MDIKCSISRQGWGDSLALIFAHALLKALHELWAVTTLNLLDQWKSYILMIYTHLSKAHFLGLDNVSTVILSLDNWGLLDGLFSHQLRHFVACFGFRFLCWDEFSCVSGQSIEEPAYLYRMRPEVWESCAASIPWCHDMSGLCKCVVGCLWTERCTGFVGLKYMIWWHVICQILLTWFKKAHANPVCFIILNSISAFTIMHISEDTFCMSDHLRRLIAMYSRKISIILNYP